MLAAPAFAQSADEQADVLAEIDRQSDAARHEGGVLASSEALAAAGDLSGAASVLEAFLIENEESVIVRGRYAVTLCQLDDLQSGRFEAAKVAAQRAPVTVLGAITAACGPIPQSATVARGGEIGQ